MALSDQARWLHVERAQHDSAICLYTRIAGVFVPLYAKAFARA